MLRNNLVRRTPTTTAFDRFFAHDPFFGSGWTSWPETRNASLDTWSPSVDVHEEESAFVFTADLPGVKKSAVDVTVEDNVLTVSGERSLEKEVDENTFRRIERSFGKFSRRFSLSSDVDAANVAAVFKDGVLTIHVPKSETAKPQRIKIQ